MLHLKRAVHTRWLSHDQAVTAIRRTLNSLLAALERAVVENDDAVARAVGDLPWRRSEWQIRFRSRSGVRTYTYTYVHARARTR